MQVISFHRSFNERGSHSVSSHPRRASITASIKILIKFTCYIALPDLFDSLRHGVNNNETWRREARNAWRCGFFQCRIVAYRIGLADVNEHLSHAAH